MKQAKWMWEYGEYEMYHNMLLHSRREKGGIAFPTKFEAPKPWVDFFTEFTNQEEGFLKLFVNGKGYVQVDNLYMYAPGQEVIIEPGEHHIDVRIMNVHGFVCAYIESDICPSGEGWYTYIDHNHLGANMVPQPVGCVPAYYHVECTPETFPFQYETYLPTEREEVQDGVLFDFGKETFGRVGLKNCKGEFCVYYGESREEALDTDHTILLERLQGEKEYYLRSRAFRYIFLLGENVKDIEIYYDYEYLPLEQKGSFRCDDEMMNKIWKVSAHTFHLNSREFYLDGIKRDRWIWAGDAYQSYMINPYIHFDKDIIRRTLIANRGRNWPERHINRIVDYSFYWIISVMDYYKLFEDLEFLKFIYPRMKTMIDFCETRMNPEGFIEGAQSDWTFVDWCKMDKEGAVCAEQILMYVAYHAMYEAAGVLGEERVDFKEKAARLYKKINQYFWDSEKGAFIDSYQSGRRNVTRHANIFAILYDFATEEQKNSIIRNVIMNDEIATITTPYFKFYELDVMAKIGEMQYVTDTINSYWGGMIRLGATSIWEEYDPAQPMEKCYDMYNTKYMKSLCHAWGAGPIYLFGRYYLGVHATSAGYRSYCVEPKLGGLKHIEGIVPVGKGRVYVEAEENYVVVETDCEGGMLRWNGNEYPISPKKKLIIKS